jgi:glycosyltransferase involved in cell wall biosynthesis
MFGPLESPGVKKMKVLVSAWACNPYEGSESAVGWGWINALKQTHKLWVITAAHQKESIDLALQTHPDEFKNVRFCYTEPPVWKYNRASNFWRWQSGLPVLVPAFHAYYALWQRHVYRVAVKLNEQIRFDLVHQLTFVGFRFPGLLWKLDLPFVWGPIGGLENMPLRLMPALGGAGGTAHYICRNVINSLQRRFLRAPRKAFNAAGSGIIAATTGIQREIRRSYGLEAQVICEVGAPPQTTDTYFPRRQGEPIRLVWSGLHLSRKALPLLFRALSRLTDEVDWRLEIYGDGPCRKRWHRMATELGLQDRCTWQGQVSRNSALAGLRTGHLFIITSVQDLTSTVLIEALANGLPVLCPDHCGFTDVITSECGIKLPIRVLTEFEKELTASIKEIYRNEERRRCLAAGALLRSREFSWEAKGKAINLVYERVVRNTVQRGRRPNKAAPA